MDTKRALAASMPPGREWYPVGLPLRLISPSNTCHRLISGLVDDHCFVFACDCPALFWLWSVWVSWLLEPPRASASRSMPNRSRLTPKSTNMAATIGMYLLYRFTKFTWAGSCGSVTLHDTSHHEGRNVAKYRQLLCNPHLIHYRIVDGACTFDRCCAQLAYHVVRGLVEVCSSILLMRFKRKRLVTGGYYYRLRFFAWMPSGF